MNGRGGSISEAADVVGSVGGVPPEQAILSGVLDPVLLRFDSDGNEVWSTRFSTGFGSGSGNEVTVGDSGSAYVRRRISDVGTHIVKFSDGGKPMWDRDLSASSIVLDANGDLLVWPIVLLPVGITVLHYRVIAREESHLERVIGDEYRQYKARVRRWV